MSPPSPADVVLNLHCPAQPFFYTTFACGIAADFLLAGMLCLWLHRSRTGLKRSVVWACSLYYPSDPRPSTDSMINTLMVYAIETGEPCFYTRWRGTVY